MLDPDATEGLLAMLCDWRDGSRHTGECFPNSTDRAQPVCMYYVPERGCDRVHGLLHYLKSRRVVIAVDETAAWDELI